MGTAIYNLLVGACGSSINLANSIGFWPATRQMYISCTSTIVGWDIFFKNLVNFLLPG